MRQTIYLVANRNGIDGAVRKNLPTNLRPGDIPIKVMVDIKPEAFTPPVIEQYITIEDPYKGIDLSDVHFTGDVITEAEAQIIRTRRLERAAEILRANGYEVEKGENV